MIRVKLLSEPDYEQMCREQSCTVYRESDFFELLREKKVFSDVDSCRLLRLLHGDAAVEQRWYGLVTQEGKPCLPAISQEAKYGLTVIENSRRGVYTDIVDEFTEFQVEARMGDQSGRHGAIPLVWDAFAALEVDILLFFRKKDFSFGWDIPLKNGFLLENYPGEEGPIEVQVRKDRFGDPVEENGVLQVSNFFYDQQYDWTREVGELLEELGELNGFREPLVKGMMPLAEFQWMIGSEDYGRNWELWEGKEQLGYENLMDYCLENIDLCDISAVLDAQGDQQRHAGTRVLNHMDYLPDSSSARRLAYLIIEKHDDGSYQLQSQISVKYPSYGEMLEEAMEMAIPDGEVLVMPVNVEEIMMRAADIKKALCAFRVAGNLIETFGKEEGLIEFAALLKEARDSGRCVVSEDCDEDKY